MFKFGFLLLSLSSLLLSCTPSPESLKKTLRENPDILHAAIEADPEGFIEVVNNAALVVQNRAQEKFLEEEREIREEKFKNPLDPDTDEKRAIRGPKDAPITIVEYSDFQCGYCAQAHGTVEEVMSQYEGKVRLIYKHLPLEIHKQAIPAAKVFEAIALQDPNKAYAWHDIVFGNQDQLREGGLPWMKDQARKLGVDIQRLDRDMESEEVEKRIEADMVEAGSFGFSGTPVFLINGVSLEGAHPPSAFQEVIDRHLQNEK